MSSRRPSTSSFLLAATLAATAACAGQQGSEPADTSAGEAIDAVEQAPIGDDEIATIDEGAVATAPADRNPEPDGTTDPTVPPDTADLTISAAADPDNTLIAEITVGSSPGAAVDLSITADGVATRRLSSATATDHQFTVVGLRSDTTYQFTAESADGTTEATSFTTGSLPADAPDVSILTNETSTENGITMFGIAATAGTPATGPEYWGVDEAGHIVWYLDSDESASNDPVVRDLGGGEILAFFSDSLQHLALDGTVLATYDLSAVSGWHHDAVVLDDGGVLALSNENRTIDGTELRGDTIVELDASGAVVWEWSTFDHLDTSRFPGALSAAAARSGGLDWTHANSIEIDETTGEIIISLRSQHWIVNIDHDTGDVNWIAGDDSEADIDAPFFNLEAGTWTSGQHAATFTASGELLVYDNRNETGGETSSSRIVAYELDEATDTATQVFDYDAPKFTRSLGDVDELANTNLLLTAGGPGSSDTAHLVEVDRSGNTIWEATLVERIYRSERIAWRDIGPIETDTDSDPDPDGAVDITGVTLTSTSADCSTRVGEYTSAVTDVSNGTDFAGELVISVDGDTCTLASNQIPNHDISIDTNFANDAGEVDGSFTISASPTVNAEPTDLGFTSHAVMLNGVIWEAFPAACFDEGPNELGREAIGCGPNLLDHPWRYNVGSPDNAFRLDAYSAHAQANGLYHYHSTPEALYEIECNGVAESPVIGFARDGFPIYGPCFADEDGTIRSAQSSYELLDGERQDVASYTTPFTVGNVASDDYNGQFIGDYEYSVGSGDLDECNGMTVDGDYGYYITGEYPYVIACYSGTPSTTFGPTG